MQKIPVRHITTQKEPDLSESFGIRDIAGSLAGKDMVQELHRHDFFFILALQKGAGTHDIDFTPYKIGNHTVFFMRPGQVHSMVLKAGSTGFLMQFSSEYYFPHDKVSIQLLRKAGHRNHYPCMPAGFQKLHTPLASILREYTGKQERYQEVIRANMAIFFIELLRQHSNSDANNANLYLQEQLDVFLNLLETHVLTHKQVAQYAAMLHLSTYQLNTMVKTTLGKTCSALINEHIILEAKRQLLATSNQVSRIAGQLGYEDVSYFIRFFKKHTGRSPEAFRHDFS